MGNTVYLNQALTLVFSDDDDIDMSLASFAVQYWAPSNQTDTPTGTIGAGQVATTAGSPIVTISVPVDILDEPSTKAAKWRFQLVEDTTKIPWGVSGSGNAMCFDVYNRGKCK